MLPRLPSQAETDLKREARPSSAGELSAFSSPLCGTALFVPHWFPCCGICPSPSLPSISDYSRSVLFPAVPSCGLPLTLFTPIQIWRVYASERPLCLCLIWPWLVFVLDSEVSAGDCGLLFVSDSWCQHRTVHREVLVTIPWFN